MGLFGSFFGQNKKVFDADKDTTPEGLEKSATYSINLINKKINSQELARITAWMMYCNFDNSSWDRQGVPVSIKNFLDKCTEGLTMFDKEYDDVLEKNIRREFYIINNEYYKGALDIFLQIIHKIKDEKVRNKLGYSILEKFITNWKL